MSYKGIGNTVILKVLKRQSTLDLSMMAAAELGSSVAVVDSVGTGCVLGLEVGHEVMVKAGTRPIEVESTEEYDLLLIPETSVAYVTNWSDK